MSADHADGNRPRSVRELLEGLAESSVTADRSSEEVRRGLADQYGYRDWQHVEANGDRLIDWPFEAAVDAVVGGDVERLRSMLDEDARSSTDDRPSGTAPRCCTTWQPTVSSTGVR